MAERCADAILAVDREGVVRFMNVAAERLLKKSARKMMGEVINLPVDPARAQEVSIPRGGHDSIVAEILSSEVKWGREKIYILCLRDITDRVRLEEQLRALSNIDPLTGLLNRRGFLTSAHQQLSLAQRTKREMSCFFLDLDGLKAINDAQGHMEGDQALMDVARILEKTFREPDIIGRYGGDEFAILAVEAKGRSASAIASRLTSNLNAHNKSKRKERKLSFSLGVANFNHGKNATIQNLIDEADELMYKNKSKRARRT